MSKEIIHYSDLLLVFAQSEQDQETYFPDWEKPMCFDEERTTSARYVALCILRDEVFRGNSAGGELGQLCREIEALSSLIIALTYFYDWLVWHPRAVKAAEKPGYVGALPDPIMYEVWSVLRRLCKEAVRLHSVKGSPPPFADLFSSVITVTNGS